MTSCLILLGKGEGGRGRHDFSCWCFGFGGEAVMPLASCEKRLTDLSPSTAVLLLLWTEEQEEVGQQT